MVGVALKCVFAAQLKLAMKLLLVVIFLAPILSSGKAQTGCNYAPLWLLTTPEDLENIFPGLADNIFLVENGRVSEFLSNPTSIATQLVFFFSSRVSEFSIIMCRGEIDKYLNISYSISLRSNDTTILAHPIISIPFQGYMSVEPYRFIIPVRCVSTSNTAIPVKVTFNTSSGSEMFCPVTFFYSIMCDEQYEEGSGGYMSQLAPLGIVDGPVPNLNTSFKDSDPIKVITRHNNLVVILPSVFVPLFVITLIALLLVFTIWSVWYKKHTRAIAQLQPDLEFVSHAYQDVYLPWKKLEPHEKEFPLERIKIIRELGEGAFGIVYQAEANGIMSDELTTDVAVKQLRQGSNEVDDFFREVNFMSQLDHPNVVKLLGVCSLEEPFSMVFEYMDLGDLCHFLRAAVGLGPDDDEEEEEEEKNGIEVSIDEPLLTIEELLIIAHQVAQGMVYISSQQLVHRDLATRNCLVATGLVVKIADFGMSRNINTTDYYRVHGSAVLPVRWMPPESIRYGKFTTQSDIWAFGILLWEVFSFGKQPYFGLLNEEVVDFVQKGGVPEIPADCPANCKDLMTQCWDKNPKKRPVFTSIASSIETIMEEHS